MRMSCSDVDVGHEQLLVTLSKCSKKLFWSSMLLQLLVLLENELRVARDVWHEQEYQAQGLWWLHFGALGFTCDAAGTRRDGTNTIGAETES